MFDVTLLTEPQLSQLREFGNLTERERTLLELKNQGKTNEECADLMIVSDSTISRTIKRLKMKSEMLGIIVPKNSTASTENNLCIPKINQNEVIKGV